MGFFDNKTEAPTPQRREDARKKGQIAKSIEANAVITLIVGIAALKSFLPAVLDRLQGEMVYSFGIALSPAREGWMRCLGPRVYLAMAAILIPFFTALVAVALLSNGLQTRFLFNLGAIKVDFSRIAPAAGLKRMVSGQALRELLKGGLKVGLAGYVAFTTLRGFHPQLVETARMAPAASLELALHLTWQLCWRLLLVLAAIAALDFYLQWRRHEESLRMTKEETKEEMKRSEGNPQVKGRIRSRMRQIVMRRMMNAVPRADVVVTNPTHVAVALRYDRATMRAPRVVAKGLRLIAERIKELARLHHVPIVENPPLARALYYSVDLGQDIPPELYQAVAEVLAAVYRVRQRAAA